MEKELWKSKTVWGCCILALAVLYRIAVTGSVTPEDLMALATALGLFGIRDSIG